MSSVLEEMVKNRQRGAVANEGRRAIQSKTTEALRFISVVVMAVAVLRYHELLFTAAQPMVNRLYELLRH